MIEMTRAGYLFRRRLCIGRPCARFLCPRCLCAQCPFFLVPLVLQWNVIVLDDCVPDVFVMGACWGCLFCMSVCIMYVCRIYILYVCVLDDCVAVLGVRHLFVFNAQIWNVCLQNVCDQCLFGERLCGFKILLVMGSFVLDASVRDLRIWLAEFSLCVSGISALDECLLENCLKNDRVLNA